MPPKRPPRGRSQAVDTEDQASSPVAGSSSSGARRVSLASPGGGSAGATGSGVRPAVGGRMVGMESSGDQRTVARLKPEGMGLRAKFMVVMAILTAIGMIALGVTLSTLAGNFLLTQAQHKGIELTKMTAQVARAVLDSRSGGLGGMSEDRSEQLNLLFNNATRWGKVAGIYSDIDSIQFGTTMQETLKNAKYGNVQIGSGERGDYQLSALDVPKRGKVSLPSIGAPGGDIEVYRATKNTGIEVFRFKVLLNQSTGEAYASVPVVMDIRTDTITALGRKLWLIIGLSVAVMLGLMLFAANFLARLITRPVRLLMRDMREVSKGNLDHRTKPHSRDEIGVLANEFNLMTQNLKVAQSALVEQEKAEYELSLAREVQQQLLPAEVPPIVGYSLMAFYKGARQVSGDYYDFFPLGDGLWGFIVADVSGKGIPGSMVMAVTRTIVRLVAQKHRTRASETLKETNRLIAKQIKRGMFVTAFYAILDHVSGRIVFASAGHNPMVIYRHAQRGYELAQPKGIAIGFDAGPKFDATIQEFETSLAPGDGFTLYTDGFPEAMNEQNQEFGEERFFDACARYGAMEATDTIRNLLAEITQHRGRAQQSDDLTIITVRRQET